MTQNAPDDAGKMKSPHSGLQAILPKFRALNPEAAEARPIFDNRAKARLFIDIQPDTEQEGLRVMAVWQINHADLEASHIRGWSVTRWAS